MFRFTRRLALIGLLAGGIAVATGCGKKGRPPIDQSAIVGSWIEVVAERKPNPRVPAGPKSEDVRYITLNADNSFEFTLCTQTGAPLKDAHKATGTWRFDSEQNTIIFEVADNTFPKSDERRDWAPESSIGVTRRSVSGHGELEVLTIMDLQGGPAMYKRTP